MPSKHRNKPRFRRRTEPGAPPETVQIDPTAAPTDVRIVVYSPSHVMDSIHLDNLPRLMDENEITWVDVVGLRDKEVIEHKLRYTAEHSLPTLEF